MQKISILYYGVSNKDSANNYDYIVNDIFKNYDNIECDYVLIGKEKEEQNKIYDVFVYNCTHPERPNYFGFSPSYEQVKSAVFAYKPKIIIQLIDEYSSEHNEIHNLLGNFCNLFLRQHRHESHIHLYTNNTLVIPLGYINGFYNRESKIKPIKDRKYYWSWVGFLKSDRYEMINTFWRIWGNITICNANIPTKEVFDIYSDSIFVPCGRGNFSLECFRNYEATISGAIPVVVGSQEELDYTYGFEEKPPWIYAHSWQEALGKCQEIQFNSDKLQEMQNENIAWWNRMMKLIQDKVQIALQEELVDYSSMIDKVFGEEKNIPKPVNCIYYT